MTANPIVSIKLIMGTLSCTKGIRSVVARNRYINQNHSTTNHIWHNGLNKRNKSILFLCGRPIHRTQIKDGIFSIDIYLQQQCKYQVMNHTADILFYITNSMSPTVLIVQTTLPKDGRGIKRIINILFKKKLVACVQKTTYVTSYYIRENKLTRTPEQLVTFKTLPEHKEELIQTIKKLHPYETPEILCWSPDEVDPNYLTWMRNSLNSPTP